MSNGACGAPLASRIALLVCFISFVLWFFFFLSNHSDGDRRCIGLLKLPLFHCFKLSPHSEVFFICRISYWLLQGLRMSGRFSRTIYVGNLPADIRESEVEDLFYKVWFSYYSSFRLFGLAKFQQTCFWGQFKQERSLALCYRWWTWDHLIIIAKESCYSQFIIFLCYSLCKIF